MVMGFTYVNWLPELGWHANVEMMEVLIGPLLSHITVAWKSKKIVLEKLLLLLYAILCLHNVLLFQ